MIDTIFYFPESLSYDAYLNMLQSELITNRTIVFAKQQGSIYMGGKIYGLPNDDLAKKTFEPKGNNNTLTQSDFNQDDTVYTILYDFDLGGQEIIIPENCIIDFEGGKISNGTLIGNDTLINAPDKTIFDGVNISGTWNVPNIWSDWFADAHEENGLQNCIALSSNDIYNTIRIGAGVYEVSTLVNDESALKLNSNTHVIIAGKILMVDSDFTNYSIFDTNNKNNITIEGGILQGNNSTHSETGGEWGFGIYIRGGKNIVVEDVEIYDCWGDGIYVRWNCECVKISNCHIHNCRRLGISVVSAIDVIIDNNIFHDIDGTGPGAAVDIEPNALEVCKNIVISNNNSYNCLYGIIVTGFVKDDPRGATVEDVTISNNIIRGYSNPTVEAQKKSQGIFSWVVTNVTVINNNVECYHRALQYRGTNRGLFQNNTVKVTGSIPYIPANDDEGYDGCVFAEGYGGAYSSKVTIDSNVIISENMPAFNWLADDVIINNKITCNRIVKWPYGYTQNVKFENNTVDCYSFEIGAGENSLFANNTINVDYRMNLERPNIRFEGNRVTINNDDEGIYHGRLEVGDQAIFTKNIVDCYIFRSNGVGSKFIDNDITATGDVIFRYYNTLASRNRINTNNLKLHEVNVRTVDGNIVPIDDAENTLFINNVIKATGVVSMPMMKFTFQGNDLTVGIGFYMNYYNDGGDPPKITPSYNTAVPNGTNCNIIFRGNNIKTTRSSEQCNIHFLNNGVLVCDNYFDKVSIKVGGSRQKFYNNIFYHPIGTPIDILATAGDNNAIVGNYIEMDDNKEDWPIYNQSTAGSFLIALNTFVGNSRKAAISNPGGSGNFASCVYNFSQGGPSKRASSSVAGFIADGMVPSKGTTADMVALIADGSPALSTNDEGFAFYNTTVGYPCYLKNDSGTLKWVKADGTDAPTV